MVGPGSNTAVMVIKAPLPQGLPAMTGGLPRGCPCLSTFSSMQEVSVTFKFSVRGSIREWGRNPT